MIFGFFDLNVSISLSVVLAARLWRGQSSANEAQVGKE